MVTVNYCPLYLVWDVHATGPVSPEQINTDVEAVHETAGFIRTTSPYQPESINCTEKLPKLSQRARFLPDHSNEQLTLCSMETTFCLG